MADPKIKEYRGRIVKNTGDGMLVEFPRVVDAVSFCSVLTGDARFLPRFLLLLGELAMCLGEAGEVAPGLATVVDSTGPADSRRSPGSCEPPPASRGRGEIKIELRRRASF